MTCRDRNINATKALFAGIKCEGVNNVLTVTWRSGAGSRGAAW